MANKNTHKHSIIQEKCSLDSEDNLPSPFFKNCEKEAEVNEKKDTNKQKNQSSGKLKLKDYLRLKSLSQRSNSNHSKREDSPKGKKNEDRHFHNSTDILKQEIISDLKECAKKIMNLEESGKKVEVSSTSPEQQYEELIFLCELQHIIKERLMPSLEATNEKFREQRVRRMMKYASKTGITDPGPAEIKQKKSPLRKKIDYLRATEALGFMDRKIYGSII